MIDRDGAMPLSWHRPDDSPESSSFLDSGPETLEQVLWETFDQPIVIEDSWRFSDHPLSPTFGDPTVKASESGIDYRTAGLDYMRGIADKRTQWLSEGWRQRIDREIETAHDIRCDQNIKSMNRMRTNAAILGLNNLDMTTRESAIGLRSGQAVTLDRVNLLARYPGAVSIEDIKHTGCMFDNVARQGVVSIYAMQLERLQSEGITVTMRTPDETGIISFDTSSVSDGMLIVKQPLATIEKDGTAIEAIIRTNFAMLPPDMKTPEWVHDNIVTIMGVKCNLQTLFLSGYLSVKDVSKDALPFD